eukprot:6194877-Pleurochrysis_carterae.AAC.2
MLATADPLKTLLPSRVQTSLRFEFPLARSLLYSRVGRARARCVGCGRDNSILVKYVNTLPKYVNTLPKYVITLPKYVFTCPSSMQIPGRRYTIAAQRSPRGVAWQRRTHARRGVRAR